MLGAGDISGGLNPLLPPDGGCQCVGHKARAPGSSSLANKQPESPGCWLRAFPRALRAGSSQVLQPLGRVVKATGTPTSPYARLQTKRWVSSRRLLTAVTRGLGPGGDPASQLGDPSPRVSRNLLLPLSPGTQRHQHRIAPVLFLKATLGDLTSKTSHSRKSAWFVPGSPATEQRETNGGEAEAGAQGAGPRQVRGRWQVRTAGEGLPLSPRLPALRSPRRALPAVDFLERPPFHFPGPANADPVRLLPLPRAP